MEQIIQERENALKILDKQLYHLSNVFKKSYLKKGRGALVVHIFILESNHQISTINYNNKNESLNLFDNKKSRKDLKKLIDNYNPKTEGILILITKSNATWFVTVNLKSHNKKQEKNKN
jgi:predicted transcriptional regulator